MDGAAGGPVDLARLVPASFGEWAALHRLSAVTHQACARLRWELAEALQRAAAAPEPWSTGQAAAAERLLHRLGRDPKSKEMAAIAAELRALFGARQEEAASPVSHHRTGPAKASNADGSGGTHAPNRGAADAQEGDQPTQNTGRRHGHLNG